MSLIQPSMSVPSLSSTVVSGTFSITKAEEEDIQREMKIACKIMLKEEFTFFLLLPKCGKE